MHIRSACVAGVLLLLLAGCGDDDDTDVQDAATETTEVEAPSAAGGLTAADCPVTLDEVSAAVGLPMSSAEIVDSGDGAWCSFVYLDGMTTVNVDVFETTGEDAMDGARDAYLDAERTELVQGGDEAVWSSANGALVARDGDRAVRVFVDGPDVELDGPYGVAVVIAEAALGLEAAPAGSADDSAAALELFQSYEDECAAHADTTGNTAIASEVFAGAAPSGIDASGNVIVEDGAGGLLVADLSNGTFSGLDGPDGELPSTYAFACPPELFVGTAS